MLESYTIVAWGGYQYFNDHIDDVKDKVKIQYLYANAKYVKNKHQYQLINKSEDILKLDKPYIIICLAKEAEVRDAATWCKKNKIPFIHMEFLFNRSVFGVRYLKAVGGIFRDAFNNVIDIDENVPETIIIDVAGAKNSFVKIGNIQVKERLHIKVLGHDGRIEIGDGTTIVSANMIVNTLGKISIGKDCMFAHSISIMQSDQHLIFDKESKLRINNTKNIMIGNHVWIGRETELLGGAEIGDGSVCGARTVTSGKFPGNVILAGCPARVIRENILWSRDLIENSDFDCFEKCKDQKALVYAAESSDLYCPEGIDVKNVKKDSLEEMIIHLYQSGITTVGIAKLIEKMYGQYYVPKKK